MLKRIIARRATNRPSHVELHVHTPLLCVSILTCHRLAEAALLMASSTS